MTDIRTLLHDAAPSPTGPLDMAAVRARARRSPGRRLAAWIVGAGALIGVGVPVGNAVLVTGGHDTAVEVVDPTPTTGVTTTSIPAAAPQRDAPATDREYGAGSTASNVTDAESALPASSGSEAPTMGYDPPYPRASECSVDTYGLASGDARTCRFTATAAGGWNYYQPPHGPTITEIPYIEVSVTRGDETRVYRTERVPSGTPTGGYRLKGCDDDIIRPGDRVEVLIQQADPWMDIRNEMGVGAGSGWGCSDPGP